MQEVSLFEISQRVHNKVTRLSSLVEDGIDGAGNVYNFLLALLLVLLVGVTVDCDLCFIRRHGNTVNVPLFPL